MDNEQQDMCNRASMNARALEEMMLTCGDTIALTNDEAHDVIGRCEQIIECMKTCFDLS